MGDGGWGMGDGDGDGDGMLMDLDFLRNVLLFVEQVNLLFFDVEGNDDTGIENCNAINNGIQFVFEHCILFALE